MNKYWSNEDDKKVSYIAEQPPRNVRASESVKRPVQRVLSQRADDDTTGSFYAAQRLNRDEGRDDFPEEPAPKHSHRSDRSTFISDEIGEPQREETQYAPPPKFQQPQDAAGWQPAAPYAYADGYQVRSEHPRGHRRGFLIFLIVVLVLLLIGCGAYIFRYQILDLVGKVFGEEVMWKLSPTPAPTEAVTAAPAYVESPRQDVKIRAKQEIDAVAGGLNMKSYTVTDHSVVMQSENPDGTSDYYLFAADTGRLLGYYEKLKQFVACSADVFYIGEDPYLITSQGFPLVDPASFVRSAGGDVKIQSMINGWATVSDLKGTAFNFVNGDGTLISDLWFAKAFPFTADTTLAYVDTGNLSNPESRYALYLLRLDGETKRLNFAPNMDNVLDSVCGMAFTQSGDMLRQDEALALVANTDDTAAYVNCGALVVRDSQTKLYGLFVNGVQQYPFAFDSIEPMPSDVVWAEVVNGFVRRYAVEGKTYPLPSSYSFILKQGDTEQTVSIAAVSEYPIVFD